MLYVRSSKFNACDALRHSDVKKTRLYSWLYRSAKLFLMVLLSIQFSFGSLDSYAQDIQADNFSSCPSPEFGFETYKVNLETCFQAAGLRLSDELLNSLKPSAEGVKTLSLNKQKSNMSIQVRNTACPTIESALSQHPDLLFVVHEAMQDRFDALAKNKGLGEGVVATITRRLFVGYGVHAVNVAVTSTPAGATRAGLKDVQEVAKSEKSTKAVIKSEGISGTMPMSAAAVVGVAALAGGGGGGGSSGDAANDNTNTSGGNGSPAGTVDEHPLNAGIERSYDAGVANARVQSQEFSDTNYRPSMPNPLTTINAHKAAAYGLTGANLTVQVIDSCYNPEHQDLASTTITSFGDVSTCRSSDVHGAAVGGLISADANNSGLIGIAPEASLEYADTGNNTLNVGENTAYRLDKLAAATDSSQAVVQNNSWLLVTTARNCPAPNTGCQLGYDAVKTRTDNGDTATQAYSALITASNWVNPNGSSVDNYVRALNDFQEHGSIVFALSNYMLDDDAHALAALPEFYSELQEAWITVANVDVSTSSGSRTTYSLKSGQCGVTARYCIAADGYEINTLGTGTNGYESNMSGTSFTTPMVSAALVLLKEAFPTHTPEQLVDRLLASADNDWGDGQFVAENYVLFGNGVRHYYNREVGHGMLDIYAALQPITADGTGAQNLSIYAGSESLGGTNYGLSSTGIETSPQFGDAISNALAGELNYFSDDMNGAFAYNMSGHISGANLDNPVLNLSSEMITLSTIPLTLAHEHDARPIYLGMLGYNTIGADDVSINFSLARGDGDQLAGEFFSLGSELGRGFTSYDTPYLMSEENGESINAVIDMQKTKVFFGFNRTKENESNRSALFGETTLANWQSGSNGLSASTYEGQFGSAAMPDYSGAKDMNERLRDDDNRVQKSSFTVGAKYYPTKSVALGLIAGQAREENGSLGLTGSGALDLRDAVSFTDFYGLNIGYEISKNLALRGKTIISETNMELEADRMLRGADGVSANSFYIELERQNLFGNDVASISIGQPSCVYDGTLGMRLADRAAADGTISYRDRQINLAPSGRQIDLSVAYAKMFLDDIGVSLKLAQTSDVYHIASPEKTYSGFAGLTYGDVMFAVGQRKKNTEVRATYIKRF